MERKPDVKTDTESSEVESQLDSTAKKSLYNIPDLLIPMRLSILSNTDNKDVKDETPEKCNGNPTPGSVKKYDFSSFLSWKTKIYGIFLVEYIVANQSLRNLSNLGTLAPVSS